MAFRWLSNWWRADHSERQKQRSGGLVVDIPAAAVYTTYISGGGFTDGLGAKRCSNTIDHQRLPDDNEVSVSKNPDHDA